MIESVLNKVKESNTSYLFIGDEGVGKRYAAINIAKDILNNDPRVDKNIHPNVIIIEPENKDIKIESIRNLIKDLVFAAPEGNKRFVIIDEAHRMNQASANALLKTLEEPPQDTVFFLLSSNMHKMLPTIISRCELVKFPPLENSKLSEILDIDSNHPFIEYAMGSASRLEFYITHENEILALINFLNNPTKSYKEISEISTNIVEATSGSIEHIEYIFSIIIKQLLSRVPDNPCLIDCINRVQDISKKLYMNTSASIVIENMLLEASKEISQCH